MRHRYYDVIVAWAEGKTIEYRSHDMGDTPFGEWTTIKHPSFNVIEGLEYRIKPQEWWAPVFNYNDSTAGPIVGACCPTKAEADQNGKKLKAITIKFIHSIKVEVGND